ncbi:uncharacterized protein LOC135849442 isoform X3 [Planococcus citri]|uniref:uncharacterized protein LOC135849442 isoform X3 n=1 Tax=Planococcus citri TaxID=170843 RepID=UPI0031F95C31
MTEISSEVYDIFHPTPVSLKQISAIAVSRGVWCCEMNYYRNGRLSRFHPKIERNSLKSMLPILPSAIFELIYEYVVKFGSSLKSWLHCHYDKVSPFRDRCKNEILQEFDDFVYDHNGLIDHTRTAKRLMHCIFLKECEKFRIACTYFFEDHIMRIWPNVRTEMNTARDARFDLHPQLYYWICYLKNELNMVTIQRPFSSIDELMFDECLPDNRPSVEYFWFRIPVQRRLHKAFYLFDRNVNSFLKFILQKLDDQQLNQFVNGKGCELMIVLSARIRNLEEELFLPTWKYIKSRVNDNTLAYLISNMFQHEAGGFEKFSSTTTLKHWSFLCSEIWDKINPDLKPSIVGSVLSRHELFEPQRMTRIHFRSPEYWARYMQFLLTILSCATFVQKKSFLRNCWSSLIKGARVEELQQIIKLCFENDEEIAEFKKNTVASSQTVRRRCVLLLLNADFDELNALVDFCNPDSETARICKQEVLRSSFLGQSTSLNPNNIKNGTKFRVFVDNAFKNAELSTDFKNQLMSLPENQEKLTVYLSSSSVSFEALMEFVDVFPLAEQTAMQIKDRIKNYLIELASDPKRRERRDVLFKKSSFDQFLLWCFGSDGEVATFKLTYSVND